MLFSDDEALFEMDSKVHHHLWTKPLTDISEVHSYIESVRTQYIKIILTICFLKETEELIGWAGLKYNNEMVNNKIHFYDIG
jgi:hypothetical protein